MKTVTTRRISQVFFFVVFVWFCIITIQGTRWWQLRGWPVNLFLNLDPLAAIGTLLSTHTLYAGLLWALVTVVMTIILGRFFCGWVCPFGSIHQFMGHIAHRKKSASQKIKLNKYHKAQCIKYFVLIFFLAAAAFPKTFPASLQIGLVDPIPLVTRSFNLILLPIIGNFNNAPRYYEGALVLGTIFLAAVFMNLVVPRFYCRFICPLGALLAVTSRFAIWRVGKNKSECSNCKMCESDCQGGCEPAGKIRFSECVLCFNCTDGCKDGIMSYQVQPSWGGEITSPDISRRGFLVSLASGVLAIPAVRLAGGLGRNWHNKLIRPPGSLSEGEFLKRCLKCGQCMRICPTNVLQPAGMEMGLEALWTPVLNNRIGTSGCQLNCTACGNICPSSAIRGISLSEKLGVKEFAEAGPIRIGTAFLDRSRCLPWAMDKPCIVCQENCPLSPKAIYTRVYFSTIRDGVLTVKNVGDNRIETVEKIGSAGKLSTGDYYCAIDDNRRMKIEDNTENTIVISSAGRLKRTIARGGKIEVQIRLQKPYIDIQKCIGCGICEHECPVSGKRAVRVSAEDETRSRDRVLLLKR